MTCFVRHCARFTETVFDTRSEHFGSLPRSSCLFIHGLFKTDFYSLANVQRSHLESFCPRVRRYVVGFVVQSLWRQLAFVSSAFVCVVISGEFLNSDSLSTFEEVSSVDERVFVSGADTAGFS